jgi:hypothetical protein
MSKKPLPNLSSLPAHSSKKWVNRRAASLRAALAKAESKLFKDRK